MSSLKSPSPKAIATPLKKPMSVSMNTKPRTPLAEASVNTLKVGLVGFA
jgi:hypothetical protein